MILCLPNLKNKKPVKPISASNYHSMSLLLFIAKLSIFIWTYSIQAFSPMMSPKLLLSKLLEQHRTSLNLFVLSLTLFVVLIAFDTDNYSFLLEALSSLGYQHTLSLLPPKSGPSYHSFPWLIPSQPSSLLTLKFFSLVEQLHSSLYTQSVRDPNLSRSFKYSDDSQIYISG